MFMGICPINILNIIFSKPSLGKVTLLAYNTIMNSTDTKTTQAWLFSVNRESIGPWTCIQLS